MGIDERIAKTEGLISLSAWHNGERWLCAAQLNGSQMEVGSGDDAAAAMNEALDLCEQHRGKTPLERHPELARLHPAVFGGRKAPETLDYDGY